MGGVSSAARPPPRNRRTRAQTRRAAPSLHRPAASLHDAAPPATSTPDASRLQAAPLDSPAWYATTVAAAAATLVLTPLHVAFGDTAEFYAAPFANGDTWAEAGLAAVWAVETSRSAAARRRGGEGRDVASDLRTSDASTSPSSPPLLLDVAAVVPFDVIALACLSAGGAPLPPWLPLLRLTSLLRLHRLRDAFRSLEYNTNLSLLGVTIARNATLVAAAAHVAACAFYYGARVGVGFDPALLPGADAALLAAPSEGARYLVCLFWALTTLTSAEYGNAVPDTLAATAAATARAGLYLAFEVVLFSYILGSTSMLLVQNDERASRFRSKSAQLRGFAVRARVADDLASAMDDHLRLHFATEEAEASDDVVLAIYPTALRRRVLRHVYGATLRDAYLFASTPRRFRDAILADARLEQFLPGVDVLQEGDAVNEIYLLVSGTVDVRARADLAATASISLDDTPTPPAPVTTLGPGCLFGDLAFFTEEPHASTVTSASPVRVLTIQGQHWTQTSARSHARRPPCSRTC